jgi:fatty acid-binding protein DegV
VAVKRSFAVVTDSTADLPDEWRERYQIEVVPLKVLFGNETFRDRVDMTDDEFFRRLATATKLPTTSAPSPGEFAEVFTRLAKDHDGCISVHIGAQLSATAEAARVGAQSVEGFKVNVVDSKTVTMPLAFLCRVAAECATLEDATVAVEDNPEVKSVDRVRTRSRAIPRMVEYFRADLPVEHVAVMHAQAPDEAEIIAADLRKALPGLEIPIGSIGCVLATHTGPKALGLVYIKK